MRAKELSFAHFSRISPTLIPIDSRLEELASSPGGIRYDKVIKQTSKTGDRLQDIINSYVDLANEIQKDLLKFEIQKQTIINQIQNLNDDRFIKVLFKRYVECKSYELIAVEMTYSIENVYTIHRKALKAFSKNYSKLQ